MQVTLGHRMIRITVAGRAFDIGERGRLTGATATVLLMHLLVLWMLIANAPHPMDLPEPDVIDAELYRVEPLPQPDQPQPKPQPVERFTPRRTQPEPVPVPQAAQQPPQQAEQQTATAPQPVPAPDKSIAVAPRDTESFQPVTKPTVRPRTDTAIQSNDRAIPKVAAEEPETNPDAVKKKKREDEALDANPKLAASRDATDLRVHETPLPSVDASAPAPSGLSPDTSHLASSPAAGGQPGSGSRAAAGAAALGRLKGGRNGVTQALQNHESCVQIQQTGKTPPRDCDMPALGQVAGLGLKPDARLQAAAAARDAEVRYKTQPGNADYWKRVNAGPQSRYDPDDTVKPGQYSNDKDDRTRNGTNNDPKAKVSY